MLKTFLQLFNYTFDICSNDMWSNELMNEFSISHYISFFNTNKWYQYYKNK